MSFLFVQVFVLSDNFLFLPAAMASFFSGLENFRHFLQYCLLVMQSLSFCLCEDVFISHSLLKDNFQCI